MRITGEIFQVGGGHLTSPEDAAIYLINLDGHAALVDAGCGRSTQRVIKHIQANGVDPGAGRRGEEVLIPVEENVQFGGRS